MNDRPIGVFDSGLGGLTILQDLIEVFPNEDFIYIGDTANLPYGTKTPEQLRTLVTEIVNKLLKFDVKAIVIACNTASTVIDCLQELTTIPIIGIIEPTAAMTLSTKPKKLLVIATNATINAKTYQKYLGENDDTFYLATSEFVTLVENMEIKTPHSYQVVKDKLSPYVDANIDCIVLGCTHFELLSWEIKAVLPDALQLSSGKCVAIALRERLSKCDGLFLGRKIGDVKVFATGDPLEMNKKMGWFTKKYLGVYKI